MNKKIAIVLFVLVALALSATLYLTWQKDHNAKLADQTASVQAKQQLSVTGLIGSEKEAFFKDPTVQTILKDKYKISVSTESVGSRRIATEGGSKGKVSAYDFAFPSGSPSADKITQDFKPIGSYRLFFTPMAIASWQPITDVLEKNGIVQKTTGHYRIIDMQKLLHLMTSQTRWQDLPNNTGFKVGRKVLIKSTDIASSNSAAMYLSLASYLSNNNTTVSNSAEVAQVLPQVAPLFTTQGYMAGSSATPFEDYLLKGMGNSPLVMVYESQFLAQAEHPNGIRPDMVLLYPEPTIFTQHTLLAMNDKGKKLGDALTNDPELQKLAIRYGFRSNNPAMTGEFNQFLTDHKLDFVPPTLNEVIDPPSYDILEKMIQSIEQQMH